MGLSLAPATAIDPGDLAAFLRSADPVGFRRSESLAYYQWLIGPREGGETISLVALDGSRIAGALTAVLRPLHVAGEVLLSAKLEEMKTDPRDRGRGVMSRVFRAVEAACVERGTRVFFAGPTSPFSYPIFVERFGFEEPFVLDTLVCPVRVPRLGLPLPLLAGRGGTRAEGGEGISDDAAAAAAGFAATASVYFGRDAASLRWRYGAHPDSYRSVTLRDHAACRGVAVWKETRQRGFRIAHVLELLAQEPRDLLHLLAHVMHDVRGHSDAELVALWRPGRVGAAALGVRGFLPRRIPTHFLLRVHETLPAALAQRLREPRAWHLSMGDFFDV